MTDTFACEAASADGEIIPHSRVATHTQLLAAIDSPIRFPRSAEGDPNSAIELGEVTV